MGESISELRRNQKLSQSELARKCHVTQQFIQQIETGKRTPSLRVAFRLATALGVTVDALIGNPPILPKGANHPPAQDSPQDDTM